MNLRNVLLLSGLCVTAGFVSGMSGCNTTNGDDFLDLSASRGALFWWGHSTFSVTSNDGHVLLIDPYNPERSGYPRYNVAPDVVLMTHNDWDHSDTSWWTTNPTIIRGVSDSGDVATIDQDYGPFHVTTVPSLHGAPAGDTPAANAIFVIEVDGVRIVHMGDLGQDVLDVNQLAAIGTPDFLLIPVGGGNMTLNGQQACDVVNQIWPRYVLPMHFQTAATGGDLAGLLEPVDAFVQCFPANPVTYGGNGIVLSYASVVTSPTLLLLDYLP